MILPKKNLGCFPYSRKNAIKNVAIHAIRKQLYKGGVHLDAFQAMCR
jgi:hypothetical protein